MQLTLQQPAKSLNKAYLKEKVSRDNIELFKNNLKGLLVRINEQESEEHLKNVVADFLKNTWYKDHFEINTKDRNDLVIHTGKTTKEAPGVILEVKKPGNKAEMMSEARPNAKALHEIILYYLRERIDKGNIDIKYLIVTNIYEWFIMDEIWFEKNIFRNPRLKKDYENWKLTGKDTRFFYDSIAKPFLEEVKEELTATYFDVRHFEKIVNNADKADDNKLIALYKILSPAHLLKQAFINDSNSLDTKFYSELLHIIGLEEIKEGGKKLIKRKLQPDEASLLENTIIKLEDKEALRNITNLSAFGTGKAEQLFNVALELCITWINRVLFIKLLEAQLYNFHKGDKDYLFLNSKVIFDFDELSNLFFQVLAEKPDNRRNHIKEKFSKVPYLNSSLFDRIELERQTINISDLDNRLQLPLISSTVLKQDKGKRQTGALPTLQYLFEFLDAYDFTSEGGEEIQEENKNLINASVLGLIFEKINGYKDGSFFTPGFITTYMCRETLRRAVLQQFNDANGWNCKTFEELQGAVEYQDKTKRQQANQLVNSLRVCDPAVGSGHFLVSGLNELIAIKHDLKILQFRHSGQRIREYNVEVVNDELIVMDIETEELFEYKLNQKGNIKPELQAMQETLFHEKETLIENCLFGVDINPNSVKICRLRLWIELLKNAYYTNSSNYSKLETLPNIDINIKCGNSLISRFGLDADIKSTLVKSKSKWSIDSYKIAVQAYRAADSKEQKREMEELIDTIKKDFRSYISPNDAKYKRLSKLRGDLFNISQTRELFDTGNKKNKEAGKKLNQLSNEITKLESEIEEIKSNKIYEHAFEWRFEFPEVLNEEGDFVGFDVVIGNPPYIRQESIKEQKPFLQNNYKTYAGTADLYVFFVEKGMNLLKEHGRFCYILPNKWMKAGYGKALREFAADKQTELIVDFGDLPVFEEATTYPSVWLMNNKPNSRKGFKAALVDTLEYTNGLEQYLSEKWIDITEESLQPDSWNLVDNKLQGLLSKIKTAGRPLGEYVNGKIFYGIKTGYNEAFVIDAVTRERLIAEDAKSADVIKPFLAGKDIKRYLEPTSDKFLIFTKRGILIENYPAILNYLETFRNRLEPKPKNWAGSNWPGRKEGSYKWYEMQDAVDYFQEFEQPKILWPGITDVINCFAFDKNKYYGNDNNQLIVTEDLSVLGILNSAVSKWFLSLICDFVRGGFVRLKIIYVQQIPIPNISEDSKNKLEQLVSKILLEKESDPNADTELLESEINSMVYKLYDLTDEEIKIIEKN